MCHTLSLSILSVLCCCFFFIFIYPFVLRQLNICFCCSRCHRCCPFFGINTILLLHFIAFHLTDAIAFCILHLVCACRIDLERKAFRMRSKRLFCCILGTNENCVGNLFNYLYFICAIMSFFRCSAWEYIFPCYTIFNLVHDGTITNTYMYIPVFLQDIIQPSKIPCNWIPRTTGAWENKNWRKSKATLHRS